MPNRTSTTSRVFLIISLLLLPAFYFSGVTYQAIGSSIYVYLLFALFCYQVLRDKHIFQMIRVFGLAPIAFAILMTPIYFLNHLYHGTLFENAFTVAHVISAWFDVMLKVLAIGYLHVLGILLIFVLFFLFAGVRRHQQ